jgi:hypothetical protein
MLHAVLLYFSTNCITTGSAQKEAGVNTGAALPRQFGLTLTVILHCRPWHTADAICRQRAYASRQPDESSIVSSKEGHKPLHCAVHSCAAQQSSGITLRVLAQHTYVILRVVASIAGAAYACRQTCTTLRSL